MITKMKSVGLCLALLLSSISQGASPAGYFRVWEGFQKPGLTRDKFLGELPQFMADTVSLYGGRALSNYIVVVPPESKPSFIPDELALVALTNEVDYRKIRATPEGQKYSDRHWDVFDKATSRSAPQFIDYSSVQPPELVSGAAYDMIGQSIDWATGYTLAYIGIRKDSISTPEYLRRLKAHLELAKRSMVPQGLRGYIATVHDQYEVAYLNWPTKEAHDRAVQSEASQVVFADAQEFMNPLMYQEAISVLAGVSVTAGAVYSTVSSPDSSKGDSMKALIVVTSHSELGHTGKKTGYYLPEVTHPFFELTKAGFQVEIASPKGGKAPLDERSLDLSDENNKKFIENPEFARLLDQTLPLSKVQPDQYSAILFAGGHGTMWDFPDSQEVQRLGSAIYEQGGVVAAVCHGPAALVNIRLSDGRFLIAGKHVTGFTNAEEDAAELTSVVPFALETRMVERGALFEKAGLWESKVVTDGRLVTGQNPASAAGVGEAVARAVLVSRGTKAKSK